MSFRIFLFKTFGVVIFTLLFINIFFFKAWLTYISSKLNITISTKDPTRIIETKINYSTKNSDITVNINTSTRKHSNTKFKNSTRTLITRTGVDPLTTSQKQNIKRSYIKYRYVLNPYDACANKSNIKLVICVPISRKNFAGRRAIAETWGTYAHEEKHNSVLLFFIGNGSFFEPQEIQTEILKESKQYNNIVQEDYVDSYRNLSLKSISILRWVTTYCPKSQFILKADDDVYVNIPNMMILIQKVEKKYLNQPFVVGHKIHDASPARYKSSKWYTSPAEFPGDIYPPYVSGTCYAMNVKAAREIFNTTQTIPLFWLEDVFITGICRSKSGVKIVHGPGISYGKPEPNGCVFRKWISGHRYTEEQIRSIHEEIYDTNLRCM